MTQNALPTKRTHIDDLSPIDDVASTAVHTEGLLELPKELTATVAGGFVNKAINRAVCGSDHCYP